MLEGGYLHSIDLVEIEPWPPESEWPDDAEARAIYGAARDAGWPLVCLRFNGTEAPGPIWNKACRLVYGGARRG